MRKLHLILLIPFLAVFCDSCKEEEQNSLFSNPNGIDYLQLKVGNFWVYDNLTGALFQEEILSPYLDTVSITGTQEINGNTYFVFESTYNLYGEEKGVSQVVRDSSGYLVNKEGHILFSETNFIDKFRKYIVWDEVTDSTATVETYMFSNIRSVEIPFGRFNVLTFVKELQYNKVIDQQSGQMYSFHYAQGIGRVKYWLDKPLNKRIYHRRLVKYFVQ